MGERAALPEGALILPRWTHSNSCPNCWRVIFHSGLHSDWLPNSRGSHGMPKPTTWFCHFISSSSADCLGRFAQALDFRVCFILDSSFLHSISPNDPFLFGWYSVWSFHYVRSFLYKEHSPSAWPGSAESLQACQEKWHATHIYFSFLRGRGMVSWSLWSSVRKLLPAQASNVSQSHALSWVWFYVFSISK